MFPRLVKLVLIVNFVVRHSPNAFPSHVSLSFLDQSSFRRLSSFPVEQQSLPSSEQTLTATSSSVPSVLLAPTWTSILFIFISSVLTLAVVLLVVGLLVVVVVIGPM